MKKSELFAALQLGFVLSMCDGEYDPNEDAIIKKICAHFGYTLTPALLHGEIAAIDPLESVKTLHGLGLCFAVMALVTAADGKIHDDEFKKILSIMDQFKHSIPTIYSEFLSYLGTEATHSADLLLSEGVGLNEDFDSYQQLREVLVILLTRLQDADL